MITPSDIKQKAERLYVPFLRSLLQEQPFFPRNIPFGRVKGSEDYLKIKKEVATLLAGSKAQLGYGYSVELRTRKSRRYGQQSLPERIVIETEADFLKLLRKKQEVAAFRKAAALTRGELPAVMGWIEQKPRKILKYMDEWADILRVCRYFEHHPRPNLYIRDIPIKVHTKFIEEHKGILKELLEIVLPEDAIRTTESNFERRFYLRYDEPLIRVRLLDEALGEQYNFLFTDFSLPLSQFAALKLRPHRFIITENKMTFLTLPPLPNTLALFGRGFGISVLKDVNWLAICPLIYWGDLDAQGFEILSQLRSYFPHTISLMMDKQTWTTFRPFALTGTPSRIQSLPNLTPQEHELFTHLSQHNLRLEQERISQEFVRQKVDEMGQPDHPLYGALGHLGGSVASTEELDETRRELWAAWDNEEAPNPT